MAADQLLAEAEAHLTEALAALEEAKSSVPAYCVTSLRFLRSEIKVAIRRVENVRGVIVRSGRVSA